MTKTILYQGQAHLPQPPRAIRRPVDTTYHGNTLTDDFSWLRDPHYPKVETPEILEYLEAENTYFDAAMAPVKTLTDEIFEELKGRICEDDEGVPLKDGDWLYQWRFQKGEQYRRWYRKPVEGDEWVLILDEPALARGHDYFRLGGMSVSPDGNKLVYAVDTDGSERFTLRVRDLESGELLPDCITDTMGSPVWSSDSSVLLYRLVNENWRPYCVMAHRLGQPISDAVSLYEEADGGFFVNIEKTQSRKWIVISSGSHETSEVHILKSDDPFAGPKIIAPREAGHEYDIDHAGETFFIRSNKGAPNFRILTAPESDPRSGNWRVLLEKSSDIYFRGLMAFDGWLAIEQRVNGLDQVRVMRHDGSDDHVIPFPEEACRAELGETLEPDAQQIRISYESMITPGTVFDYDLETRELITRKVLVIPSGYDKSAYETVRVMAPGRDGVSIPVSIVYKKGFREKAPGPLHLYGYGAYGMGMLPSFSTARLSLLDRGFAFAIAHIRGGDELGRPWYEGGKLFNRVNVFNDFIDVAEFLVAQGFAPSGGISASGGSAGGKLMGAIANMRPDLWRAIVAHVPFVDVLSTMLDSTLPLTPIEWPEWGNPAEDPRAYDYIRSYSPYDNVKAQAYPPMMVTCGLNDPRVTYWEPAKWVAKVRFLKTDDNLVVFKTNMGAGHGGKSGRYDRLYEVAEEYSFLLMAFGLAETESDSKTMTSLPG